MAVGWRVRSWLTGVEWEAASVAPDASRRLWDAAKSKVHAPTPVEEPLPSDARFREDLRALQVQDLCSFSHVVRALFYVRR